jgi:hypothetical protein
MIEFELVSLGIALVFVMLCALGWKTTLAVLVLFTTCVFPARILGQAIPHTGIAGAEPQLMTFSAVLITAAIVAVLIGRWREVPYSFIPLLIYLLFGVLFIWGSTPEQWAGVLLFFVAVCGWYIGVLIGEELSWDRGFAQIFSQGLLLVAIVQVAASLLQLAGVPIRPMDTATAESMGSRVNGTFNHPNTLGKMIVLVILISLPLTRSQDAATRRAASLAVLLGFVPLVLSGGRSNLFGALLVIIIWTVTSPRQKKAGARIWVAIGAFIATIVALVFFPRFMDTSGGARERLSKLAMERIPVHPFVGIGVNSYVTEIGKFDPLVAQGWLVHNIFLLSTVEIGLIGATLFFCPLIWAALKSWPHLGDSGMGGDYARSYLISMPVVVVLGVTDWGMMHEYILPLWMFMGGVCSGTMNTSLYERTSKYLRPPSRVEYLRR